MGIQFASVSEQITYVGRRMFERRLADMAGGNISARSGDEIYCTPRYAGTRHNWQLDPDQILHGKPEDLQAHPQFTREGKVHLAIYQNFPDVTGIIHAHPFHVLPFCAAARPIEPVLEDTQKFGIVQVVPYAPAHSAELAANVVKVLQGQDGRIRTQAAAVLMPRHGIVVAGKDLLAALDALERIDWNAWCILAMAQMPPFPAA